MAPPTIVSFQAAVPDFLTGADSPRDFLERALDRLAECEPRLRAFTALSLPRARMAADAATARWRAGRPLSSVDGMPVGIKDVIDVAGLPTSAGSPALEGYQPWHDSAAVHALRAAGAAIVGKTTTAELAMTYPPDTRNPHDPARTPGGSSSGSAAAVGAGVLPAALGTQAIGSVLRPASFCGTYGYKPTFGTINRGGTRDFHSHSCLGVLGAGLADLWATAGEVAARAAATRDTAPCGEATYQHQTVQKPWSCWKPKAGRRSQRRRARQWKASCAEPMPGYSPGTTTRESPNWNGGW